MSLIPQNLFLKDFFIKDPKSLRNIRLGFGFLYLFLAFFNILHNNSESLSTGRWSWIYRSITATFGPYGYPAFQAIVGIAFIVWGLIAWSRHKSSTY